MSLDIGDHLFTHIQKLVKDKDVGAIWGVVINPAYGGVAAYVSGHSITDKIGAEKLSEHTKNLTDCIKEFLKKVHEKPEPVKLYISTADRRIYLKFFYVLDRDVMLENERRQKNFQSPLPDKFQLALAIKKIKDVEQILKTKNTASDLDLSGIDGNYRKSGENRKRLIDSLTNLLKAMKIENPEPRTLYISTEKEGVYLRFLDLQRGMTYQLLFGAGSFNKIEARIYRNEPSEQPDSIFDKMEKTIREIQKEYEKPR